MKFTYRMTGFDELKQSLARMSDAVQDEVLLAALVEAAEPIRSEAATLAPRSKGKGPHMADHILVAPTRFTGGLSGVAVAIGPRMDFFYAEFQEFGTAHHPAQPFMRPAFDAQKNEARKRVAGAVWHAMVGAVRR